MRGHEPLQELRRMRLLPSRVVWVSDTNSAAHEWLATNWHGENRPTAHFVPHIAIGEDDIPEALDLRVLRGLFVHLVAQRDEDRAKRLFAAIRKEQPQTLACSINNELWLYRAEDGGNGKRIR